MEFLDFRKNQSGKHWSGVTAGGCWRVLSSGSASQLGAQQRHARQLQHDRETLAFLEFLPGNRGVLVRPTASPTATSYALVGVMAGVGLHLRHP